MDFFESQDVARRNTGRLILYFVLAIVLMDALLYGATVYALSSVGPDGRSIDWWQPGILAVVTFCFLATVAMGSGLKTLELRSGGQAVAEMLGGRRVQPNSNDLSQRRLLNIVQEMALASGTPVPPVYLLENEDGINAFAAGYTPGDAVIGVNRGTIEYLNRDELQGVVAHEFSHILNGDMRLNLRLVGILHGIQLLALMGEFVLRTTAYSSGRSRRDKEDGAGAIFIIGLAAYVVGFIGLFFGRVIKSAVSRQREYLADASAVQFTRDPEGIGGALKKIGGLQHGSRMVSPEAEIASHMFFGCAFPSWSNGLFATHPPLTDRIQRVLPRFDGKFSPTLKLSRTEKRERPPTAKQKRKREDPAIPEILPVPIPGLGNQSAINAAVVLASMGQPTMKNVERASEVIESIPPQITEAAHDPYSARAIVFAMLLDKDRQIRDAQLNMVRHLAGEEMSQLTNRLGDELGRLDRASRLPLIQIVQGTLHDLAPAQYHDFRRLVQELIAADRRVSLLEFVMQRLILLRLDRHFEKRKPSRPHFHAVNGLRQEAIVLLSMLAHAGHRDEAEAAQAFQQALQAFMKKQDSAKLLPRRECRVPLLHQALDKFEQASAPVKQLLLQAVAMSVASDGEVTIAEAELMRAIADSLDCPIPVP